MKNKYETVPVRQLRWQCSESDLCFESTEDLSIFPAILGQDRAVRAITFGLQMDYPGYNIYVAGASGTGRTTTVKYLLKDPRFQKEEPDDICYVNNFKSPDMPIALVMPAGRGVAFRKEMEILIDHLRTTIPQLMESEQVREQRETLVESFNQKQTQMIKEFEQRAGQERFTIVQVQMGPYSKPDVLPLINNQPTPLESLNELVQSGAITAEQVTEIQQKYIELNKELAKVFKASQKLQKEKRNRLAALDREIIRPVIEEPLNEIRLEFTGEKLHGYLDAVLNALLDNLDLFKPKGESEEEGAKKGASGQDPFLAYRVNVIVDNSDKKGAPVIFENSPTLAKLFGTIERVPDVNGHWRTDFTKIRAGSLLLANGGYLVLHAMDVLQEPGVWNALKRVLKNRATEIVGYDVAFLFAASAMKPEPIGVNVKVIMIGDSYLYHLLYEADDEFQKIFKIRADFDSHMVRDPLNLHRYAEFIKRLIVDEKLLPFERSAVAEVAEYGVRLAGRQNKISTRFTYIADLMREAHHYAVQEKATRVQAAHVDRALSEGRHRLNLVEEKIREMIGEGVLMIDTTGSRVGQVNGLSVMNTGDYAFGMPTRITAQVAMGRSGIINIEREAAMSGPTHDKGVLILAGYLRGKFSQDKPLAISASLCFEQSYVGVDGDSASSTEIYALLSRLADLPIRQDLAVTGSVNQNGEIQPIGGVNEKIEGFFYTCKVKGKLTGTQGVLIPRRNVADLMLHTEVVEAVQKGLFNVYPVDTIDQGIEILTGRPAGKVNRTGKYPAASVFGRVDNRLRKMARGLRAFSTL
ncbi:AAA family ATPase [bacterium]|nr:AAA family ATPase [bacterium]